MLLGYPEEGGVNPKGVRQPSILAIFSENCMENWTEWGSASLHPWIRQCIYTKCRQQLIMKVWVNYSITIFYLSKMRAFETDS